jgi:hypothetical protein
MWRFQVMNKTERRKSEWLSEQSEFHSLPFRTVNHRPEISRATFFGTFLLPQKKGAPSERLKKKYFIHIGALRQKSIPASAGMTKNRIHCKEQTAPFVLLKWTTDVQAL